MQATHNEERSDGSPARERGARRAVERVALSEHTAGASVAEVVRSRIADGSHRVVVTHAGRDLTRDLIEHAFEALRYSVIVCAPDGDGDIALLGMCAPHEELLETIPWGTSAALDELLRGAREMHLSVLLLPPADRPRT